ncbi:MAG: Alpha/beta hydrolase family protein [Nocardioidaceae bacterium]|nr:Alpha/beta hydrolase family protein [Nocardioidaceae bacterium]
MSHRLVDVRTPAHPEAAVVVLHGGASRTDGALVSPTQLSVLRMVPVARRLSRAGRGRLAVFRLLNTHRGWDASATPVQDAVWALDQVRARYGDVPLGLVGHSLGGRAAILAGDQPGVRSVVALNPWVYPTDRVDLPGRQVLIVHGTDDRIASPARSARVADALRRTAHVEYRTVPGGKHAMLRHGRAFETAAASFTVGALLGD